MSIRVGTHLAVGTHTVGPDAGRLTILTFREGIGSRVGHDLTLEATRWSATVTVAAAGPAESSASATVDAASIEVRGGTGGALPLSDRDRAEIRRIMNERVLQVARYPQITFRSTEVSGTAEHLRVLGALTLVGATRPVTVTASIDETTGSVRASATVVQTEFGIVPFTAMLGALRVKDAVEVRIDLTLPVE